MIWNYRGLNDFFIDWWKLGYSQSSCWNSPTITMPIWGHDWEVTNIKHRLLEPNGKGKYRYETSGIPASAFFCDPDRTSGPLFLAEGEIKAMVTFQTLDTPTIQVAGLPSKLPSGNQLDSLKDYDPIYLCPDPDAFRDASVGRICDMLGRERVRVVQLPDKIDDLINAKLIDKSGLRRYVRHAVMA
jgi:hypothetical protein